MKNRWQTNQWVDLLQKRYWAALGLVVALGIGIGLWALRPLPLLTVNGLGAPIAFETKEVQLLAALQAQGIKLGPKDRVSPALNTSLDGIRELTVEVTRAFPVTVIDGGKSVPVETVAQSVEELFKEQAITLSSKDTVSVDLATALEADMSIKITRRTEQVSVVREEVPYELIREDDRTMVMGESKELQAGEHGMKEIKRVTYFEDGKEVSSEVLEEVVVRAPVDQIVAYGTLGVVSRGGRNYRYVDEMEMSATGYTAGKESNPNGNGYTYTGMKAVRGVVAVDPNVIPLYTRLYIEGYGPAIAADIGGAIKGNKIDLCFDSVDEALEWGRRPTTVYILSD